MPYVDAVVAVAVMRVLLFVLRVCMLRECDGARVTAMLVWGMDEVSAGHVDGTRGSGIVSSAADVLWVSVVRGMRGVFEISMCLARSGMCGEGVVDEKIGFGLYQSCGNMGSVGRVSVFGLRLYAMCGWGVSGGLDQEGWGVVMSV